MESDQIDLSDELADAEEEGKDRGLSNCWLAILLFGFFSIAGITTLMALVRSTRPKSESETRIMIRASEALCFAIDGYTQQHGHSPKALEALVPDFMAELPDLRSELGSEFVYQGGETGEWSLSIWGGSYEYTRISIDEPWFVTGTYNQNYDRDEWRPMHWLLTN